VIDLGDTIQAGPFRVADADGNPVNAETVTLTVTQPDGTTVQAAVTNPPAVIGSYTAEFTPAMAGRHVLQWLAQNPAAADADVLEVADDAALPSIVSLADAKEFLGIDAADTSGDGELRAWLAGTTEVVERVKNEVIAVRQFTVTGEENHHPSRLRLWRLPVVSLDSLARWDGTHTWDVTADVRPPDPDTGLVRLVSGASLRGALNYTYTAGYRVVPYHVQQGALVLLQHVWETQRGPGVIGGGVIGPEEAGDFKQMYMLPRKVREWLGEPRPAVA
jgi:hypothetical protein